MSEISFSRVVLLACHDLRTPLATVSGFAKTLRRTEGLDERSAQFVAMMDTAADELSTLLDELSVFALVESGRYAPVLADADTLDLATSPDPRVSAAGTGETIKTDPPALRRSLAALAVAAARYGGIRRARRLALARPPDEDVRRLADEPEPLVETICGLPVRHRRELEHQHPGL